MNNSTAFSQAFSLIKQQFVKVVTTMDSVNIFGNFSVLDFFVAMLVFGAILPIVIITVNNWSGGAVANARERSVAAERKSNTEKYRQARLSQWERYYKKDTNKKE